jgi:hypothetical protein
MDAIWPQSTEKSATPVDIAAPYSHGKIRKNLVEEAGKKCSKRSR